MTKLKFYASLLKERDWLEKMAAKGWLLTDMTMGVFYHFKEVEPCQKVFEVERFAVSGHATVKELNARRFAIDVATQSGWEVVTHDEDMNYYFVKDRAGDETDEFYDEEESRRERAERFRKHYSYEHLRSLLLGWLVVSVLCFWEFWFYRNNTESLIRAMTFYIILSIAQLVSCWMQIVWGNRFCNELSLSREEWEKRKRFGVKKHFNKVQQLRSFLQEQSEFGLSLTGYEDGKYLFEEDTCRYNYFVDTKSCLKKRLKEQGVHYTDEEKDWGGQGLKWYEMSIADAEKYDLKPVGVINRSILIYKRPYSAANLPWENGNENIRGWAKPTLIGAGIMVGACIIGYMVGYLFGMLF